MNYKIKILILEDDKNDVELLQYELKKSTLSYTTKLVQTREDFENSLETFKPDIILSDYSLPSFDGVSAFNIKQKKCPSIPFIIVSGTIGEENAVELIKNGITDYALKGKLSTVNQKIIRALDEAKAKTEKQVALERLRVQNEKLFEIAFLQSHQVRAPVAHILGLISLFNMDDPADPKNTEVIKNLHKTTVAFDDIIHQIVQKTSEIGATDSGVN
ncbi:MAG: DNA-binding transcriptional regulator BaeR [Bacteroidetes bacterium]|jgi:DNA-binding NtrC family response regulator|nr:DNA-binding transcriptional regulator BaeR [Bacteroidota bacterium]MDF2452310.1 DNA-binding transcriptional regulator BaeR [Bacteroidota bacterium]